MINTPNNDPLTVLLHQFVDRYLYVTRQAAMLKTQDPSGRVAKAYLEEQLEFVDPKPLSVVTWINQHNDVAALFNLDLR